MFGEVFATYVSLSLFSSYSVGVREPEWLEGRITKISIAWRIV